MAAPVPVQDENSSDSLVVIGPYQGGPTPAVPMSELSAELLTEWKLNKPSYGHVHFMRYLLTSGKLSDVTFTVKREDGTPEKIVAHKSILKYKSDFFAALFSDRWANDEVDLEHADFTSNDFKNFLEFLYMEQITLTNENVMTLYSMSNLYQIETLKFKCERFIEENIDEENVFELFKVVCLHDSAMRSPLLDSLIHFICSNGASLLEKSEMLELSERQLAKIFSRGLFGSSPLQKLRFCLQWAQKKYGRKKLEQYRELDSLFKYDLQIDVPRLADLLTWEESYPNTKALQPVKADEEHRIMRFTSYETRKTWTYRRNRLDRVSFRCSEPIFLMGIGLYGEYKVPYMQDMRYGKRSFSQMEEDNEEKEPAKYDVDVRIHLHGKSFSETAFAFQRAGSQVDQYSKTYRVGFKAVYLQQDEWYTLSLKISGPQSYFGLMGVKEKLLRCGNTPVVFEFKEASAKDEESKLSNPTGVPIGQIPELYFKLANNGDSDDDVKVLTVKPASNYY